ncbi:hypothetical protein [Alkaliphilus sp. B6464]|uniref:hypothetical protein n=1 Tax=Alkaliphilus sp. B6464 TaxID=2731219 RepID=UPI001BAE34A9|nr:hypothetical protein [Alkaliphilus sp. B6464]QUH21839.1 hypothetical protein HYG84_18050 [Alkaliphilus sp. B6464]
MNREDLINVIADLVFAYTNKDEEFPHDFEINAITKACNILSKECSEDKYNKELWNRISGEIFQKDHGC